MKKNIDKSKDDLEIRKKIVIELIEKFKLERIVHLVLSTLSFLLICYFSITWNHLDKISSDQIILFLGPTGFLALAITRILHMWSKSIKIIFDDI